MDRLSTKNTSIAASGTTSAEIDLGGATLVGISFPANWTTRDVSFTVATAAGGTFLAMLDLLGAALSFSAIAASKYLPIDPALFAGVEVFKIVCSSTQTNAVVPVLHIRSIG